MNNGSTMLHVTSRRKQTLMSYFQHDEWRGRRMSGLRFTLARPREFEPRSYLLFTYNRLLGGCDLSVLSPLLRPGPALRQRNVVNLLHVLLHIDFLFAVHAYCGVVVWPAPGPSRGPEDDIKGRCPQPPPSFIIALSRPAPQPQKSLPVQSGFPADIHCGGGTYPSPGAWRTMRRADEGPKEQAQGGTEARAL
jgi:hypothetical protein